MAADQLPAEVREFAHYLDGLLARLDPSGGWCAVFWQRDPEGMRACLDGRELPPWDVVEALLHDLAGQYGPGGAGPEAERARTLHASALAAYDTRPGARDALGDRIDVMLREQRYAADRQAELTRLLASATTRDRADSLRLDLAWAHDDHERATARCAELRARLADLDRREREAAAVRRGPVGHGAPGSAARDGGGPGDASRAPSAGAPVAPGPRGAGGGADGAVADGRDVLGGHGARHRPSDGRFAAAEEAARPGPRGPSAAGTPAPSWHRTEQLPDETGYSGPDGARRASGAPGREGRPHEQATGWSAPGEAAASADARPQPPAASLSATPESPASRSFATPEPPDPRPPTPKQRKRRRGSARFAGMADEEAGPVVVPPAAVPTLPEPAPVTGRSPRGARFAWAAEGGGAEHPEPRAETIGVGDRGEVARTVAALARLRGEGRSGEAHALLVEAADCSPATFPLLADELERAGLGADWQTLLWEAASLPAGRLVAAADALRAAGRAGDGQQILRQGVARPPGEVGRAVLGLVAEGRRREVSALLDAYVRARTPEEAARSAEPDPRRLVPLLLEAAQGVSEERRWDLVHALRVAGFPA
ncbi:hypothetical protein ABZ016_20145 [Streptomyces sp. NPDC006372]|uniref:hypothetical protein n=1 Tax=Streptomyces sp. NPDC006372 TaxID=3155599 RepID=UPI0033A114C0